MTPLSEARRQAEEWLRWYDTGWWAEGVDDPGAAGPANLLRAVLAEPAPEPAGVPTEARNLAISAAPLSIFRVLSLAVAALHSERHHTLACELGACAKALYPLEPAPAPDAVRGAAERLMGYLEEEVLEAKTCVGQDERTGKPCEWHRLLLDLLDALAALDARRRG